MAEPRAVCHFEWDPVKARLNRHRHRVSFEEASTVFLDPRAVSVYDKEHSLAEDRWVTLGISSAGRLLVVCHTFEAMDAQENRVRLISSRRASAKEVAQYGG